MCQYSRCWRGNQAEWTPINCHHSSTLRTHGCARSVDTFVQIKSSFSMDFPPCWCANRHSSDSRLAIKSSLLNHTSRASSSSGLIPKKINLSQSLSREMWLIINESFLTPPFLLRVARENLISVKIPSMHDHVLPWMWQHVPQDTLRFAYSVRQIAPNYPFVWVTYFN